MVHTINLSVGFCLECKTPVIEEGNNFMCRCGSLPQQSADLPATWSIPAGNISSIVNERAGTPEIVLKAKAATKAS